VIRVMTTLTQVELRAGDTVRVCWVDKPVRTGDCVTLRPGDAGGSRLVWEVTAVYGRVAATEINRGWHNNV
jgi:hypothetical protein